MRPKDNKIHVDSGVAQRLTEVLNRSDAPTQREVASKCGYKKANIITMFKQGLTRVPLEIAGRLAVACGDDPQAFLRLCLAEYTPGLLEALTTHFILPSAEEAELLQCIRRAADSGAGIRTDEAALEALEVFAKAALLEHTSTPAGSAA